jgi:hypothetical protein
MSATWGAGNIFLPEFLERFNEKFSVRAARPDNLHRRLTVSPDRKKVVQFEPCLWPKETLVHRRIA